MTGKTTTGTRRTEKGLEMLGSNRLYTFRGTSLKERGYNVITQNLEYFYDQMRYQGYVPVFGSEEIEFGDAHEHSVEWTLNILGKECDFPEDIRGVTMEGDIEWFTTEKDTSSQSLTA